MLENNHRSTQMFGDDAYGRKLGTGIGPIIVDGSLPGEENNDGGSGSPESAIPQEGLREEAEIRIIVMDKLGELVSVRIRRRPVR
jgi:hypothetical protein